MERGSWRRVHGRGTVDKCAYKGAGQRPALPNAREASDHKVRSNAREASDHKGRPREVHRHQAKCD